MRVCQFRHFGTGIASGVNQIGSKTEFRKCGAGCQIRQAAKLSEKTCQTEGARYLADEVQISTSSGPASSDMAGPRAFSGKV